MCMHVHVCVLPSRGREAVIMSSGTPAPVAKVPLLYILYNYIVLYYVRRMRKCMAVCACNVKVYLWYGVYV